jgi:four helix bundle protein
VSEQSEALKERTITFAISVLRLIDKFPNTPSAKVIAYQLAKCAPSVGANYRAACNARSRAEFIARLGIVVEEAEESEYWLLIVRRIRIIDVPEVPELHQEAVELLAIFSRSAGTARANSRSQGRRAQKCPDSQMIR